MPQIASFNTDQNASVARVLNAQMVVPVGFDVLDPMRGELQQFVSFANGRAARYRDEEVRPFLLEEFGTRLFRAGRTTHAAAMDHQREHVEQEAQYRTPAGSLDRSHDPERRARFRGMAESAAMQAIATATLADLAALVADGNLVPLSSAAFAEAEARLLELNVIEAQALEARFAARATLENPLPLGADVEAARRQAEAILKGHEATAQVIEVHARVLQDYATFLGAVFDIQPGEAFKRMVQA